MRRENGAQNSFSTDRLKATSKNKRSKFNETSGFCSYVRWILEVADNFYKRRYEGEYDEQEVNQIPKVLEEPFAVPEHPEQDLDDVNTHNGYSDGQQRWQITLEAVCVFLGNHKVPELE